uniref:Uncharacterized protein n=1 Tax=Acrobeloides nanus TaxID=290746 RepID=A0A914D9Q3_9BILA
MINRTWQDVVNEEASGIPEEFYKRLITKDARPPCLYTLIKTHKLTPADLKSTDFRFNTLISYLNQGQGSVLKIRECAQSIPRPP